MKKLFLLALTCAMLFSLAACGEKQAAPEGGENSSAETESLKEAFAEYPVLLTSGGQSADYQMIGTMMDKQDMDYYMNNLATSENLGDNKTLVIVVGGSSKGLGAAGIDADGEIARLNELMDAAEEAGVPIIAMHTGGAPRRGELSDKFIAPVFERADYAIVVSGGDQDGLMSGICAEKDIPYDAIDSISDVATVLPAAFK